MPGRRRRRSPPRLAGLPSGTEGMEGMPIRYKRSFTPNDRLVLSDWAGNRGQCNLSRQHSHHIYSPPHSRAAPCRLQTFHWWSPGRSPGSCCSPLQGDGCKWNVVHPGACRESKLIIVLNGCNCILLFLWVTIHSFMALYINGEKKHDLTNKICIMPSASTSRTLPSPTTHP